MSLTQIYSSKEVFVDQSNPTTNYNGTICFPLGVNPGNGLAILSSAGECRIWLQFDLSSIPAGSTINSVSLSMGVTWESSNSGSYSITAEGRNCSNTSWSASTITWNNAPNSSVSGTTTFQVETGCDSAGSKISGINPLVTNDVKAAFLAGVPICWRINMFAPDFANGDSVIYKGSPSGANEPHINVDYTPPAPASRPLGIFPRRIHSTRVKLQSNSRLNLCHPGANGLVGFWALNEGGGQKLFDLRQFAGNAALSGGSQITGPFGRGVRLNGVSDTIQVPDSPNLRLPSNAVTLITAWRPTANPGDNRVYASKKDAFGLHSFGIFNRVFNTNTDTDAAIHVSGSSVVLPPGSNSLTLNQYYILGLTWASGFPLTLTIVNFRGDLAFAPQVNGSNTTGTIDYDSSPLYIGNFLNPSDNTTPIYTPGDNFFTLLSARAWSLSELQQFAAAPFAMLETPKKFFFVGLLPGSASVQGVAGALSLIGKAGSVLTTQNTFVKGTAGVLSLSGKAGSVVVPQNTYSRGVAGSLGLTGRSGSVSVTKNTFVRGTSGTLGLSGKAGSVVTTQNVFVSGVKGTLTLSGKSGSVTTTHSTFVRGVTGALLLTVHAGKVHTSRKLLAVELYVSSDRKHLQKSEEREQIESSKAESEFTSEADAEFFDTDDQEIF